MSSPSSLFGSPDVHTVRDYTKSPKICVSKHLLIYIHESTYISSTPFIYIHESTYNSSTHFIYIHKTTHISSTFSSTYIFIYIHFTYTHLHLHTFSSTYIFIYIHFHLHFHLQSTHFSICRLTSLYNLVCDVSRRIFLHVDLYLTDISVGYLWALIHDVSRRIFLHVDLYLTESLESRALIHDVSRRISHRDEMSHGKTDNVCDMRWLRSVGSIKW